MKAENGKLKREEIMNSLNGRVKGDLKDRTKEFALNVIELLFILAEKKGGAGYRGPIA